MTELVEALKRIRETVKSIAGKCEASCAVYLCEALADLQRIIDGLEKPACAHPDCGRFYDHNAKRWACRAWTVEGACQEQKPAGDLDSLTYGELEEMATEIRRAAYTSRPFSQMESVKCARAALNYLRARQHQPQPVVKLHQQPVGWFDSNQDYWLIYFEEAGKPCETFTDEAGARHRYKRLLDNWNCHLFRRATREPAATPQPSADAVDYIAVLEDHGWDLRTFDTSEDEYEWRVIGKWMAKPQERVIGYGSTAVAAIKDAMRPRDYDGNLLEEDGGHEG